MEPKVSEALEFARKYLEDFLSFFGLNVTVEADIEEGTIQLNVPSSRFNGFLIGSNGDNLRAIQHLLNLALNNSDFADIPAVVDVAGYKAQRIERLADKAEQAARQVLESGEDHHMRPMNAFERRAVHAAIGEMAGVTTESEGGGPERHVVIKRNEAALEAETAPTEPIETTEEASESEESASATGEGEEAEEDNKEAETEKQKEAKEDTDTEKESSGFKW